MNYLRKRCEHHSPKRPRMSPKKAVLMCIPGRFISEDYGTRSSPPGPADRRNRLTAPRRRLLSRRRSFALCDGLVLRRTFGFLAAFLMRPIRRPRTSTRFCSRVRKRRPSMIKTPLSVMRLPAMRPRRARTSSGRFGERCASKRSCTAVRTLFTFCPPGPEERMNFSSSSPSSIAMSCVTSIKAPSLAFFGVFGQYLHGYSIFAALFGLDPGTVLRLPAPDSTIIAVVQPYPVFFVPTRVHVQLGHKRGTAIFI